MNTYPVSVAGVDLVLERSFRKSRLLRDGEELPRNPWGKYLLTGADGVEHRIEESYDTLELSPVLHVDVAETDSAIALKPMPKHGRGIWIAILLLYPAAVLFRGPFLMGGVLGALYLLTRRNRDRRHVAGAAGIAAAAVVLQILWTVLS